MKWGIVDYDPKSRGCNSGVQLNGRDSSCQELETPLHPDFRFGPQALNSTTCTEFLLFLNLAMCSSPHTEGAQAHHILHIYKRVCGSVYLLGFQSSPGHSNESCKPEILRAEMTVRTGCV